jgi:hypothetical protein
MGPEEVKFTERLRRQIDEEGLKNMNVFWGDEAHKLTREKRFAVLNDFQGKIDRGETREVCGHEIDGDPCPPACKFYRSH